jgi:transposase
MDLVDPRKGVLVGRRSPYPAELMNDAVALDRAAGGKRTCAASAADVGVTGERLLRWVRQADEHAGRDHSGGEQNTESRDEELARLRAENSRLRKAEKEQAGMRALLGRCCWTTSRCCTRVAAPPLPS